MSIADDGFLGRLRKNLQYAIQWLPKGAIKPSQVGSSATVGQVLTTTTNGSEWKTQTYNDSLLTTRGDLIRRGASAPERVALGSTDSVLTSNGTDAVWLPRGVAARSTRGSDFDTGVIAHATRSATICTALTVDGNTSANDLELSFSYCGQYTWAATTAGDWRIQFWDGTIGTGTLVGSFVINAPAANFFYAGGMVRAFVSAYTGSKTFSVCLMNTSGGNSRKVIAWVEGSGTQFAARWC